MRRHHRRVYVAVALVGASAVTLAACSSSKSPASGGSGSSAAGSNAKLSPFVVTEPQAVANSASQSGSAGIDAAVAAINKSGGLGGHPIKVNYCNASTANLAQQCARSAVSNTTVLAAVSVGDFFGAYNPIAAAGNLPSVGSNPFTAADFNCKVCFSFQAGALITGGAAALPPDVLKVNKVVIGFNDIPAGQGLPPLINSGVLGPRGLKLQASLPVPDPLPDASTIVAALPSGTGSFIPATNQGPAAQLILAIRKSGANYPISVPTPTLDAPQIASLIGAQATNIYAVSPYNLSSAGYTEYQNEMAAIGKKGGDSDNGQAIQGWLSIQLFKAAVEKVGADKVTRAAVIQAISSMTSWNTNGLTPDINFTVKQTALGGTVPNIVNATYFPYKYNVATKKLDAIGGGKFYPIFSAPPK
jgi:branched-chain amino acid transport system substrate-binding protein